MVCDARSANVQRHQPKPKAVLHMPASVTWVRKQGLRSWRVTLLGRRAPVEKAVQGSNRPRNGLVRAVFRGGGAAGSISAEPVTVRNQSSNISAWPAARGRE